jgi:hypothetical protein
MNYVCRPAAAADAAGDDVGGDGDDDDDDADADRGDDDAAVVCLRDASIDGDICALDASNVRVSLRSRLHFLDSRTRRRWPSANRK